MQAMTHPVSVRIAKAAMPPITRLAVSPDGRHTAVVQGDRIWLEGSGPLAARPGCDLALTSRRAWIARDCSIEYVDLDRPDETAIALAHDFGSHPKLIASGESIVVSSKDGTWVVRDSLAIVQLAHRETFVRSLGSDRILLQDVSDEEARPMLVDFSTEQPRAMPIAINARVLDASCLLDRTTAVLLCERGDAQELVVIRGFGNVLSRVRVKKVARIYGASQAQIVALATMDGRVIVFDLRDRRALSVDHPSPEPFPIAISPDGRRLLGWCNGLIVRDL